MSVAIVRRVLKLYLTYGLVQFVAKILRSLLQKRKLLQALKNIPRARFESRGFTTGLGELLQNLHRRHDYVDDITRGLPVSYTQAGPSIDPKGIEVLVRDPATVKHFLKDKFEKYTKDEADIFWATMKPWLGRGIFATAHGVGSSDGGNNWNRQRKIASNIFSRSHFNQGMSEVFMKKGKRFCELLEAPAATSEPVDMQAKFFQYTMDSIMDIFFGQPSDTMGGEMNKYATAFDTAHRCLMEYFFPAIPVLSLSKLAPWPFGGTNGLMLRIHRSMNASWKSFEEANETLNVESHRMIARCRSDPLLKERRDLLALFVQQVDDGSAATADWLRDVVLNFIIAGRDTTACTLSWMFFILATHPDIQKKLQEEIDSKFDAETLPTIQSLSAKELPYLNGVLYETLRLYPPVPSDGKTCMEEDVLPDGTVIPEKTRLAFMVYSMGRDPNLYVDPEQVKPERWIPFKEPSPFEFPVFQAGPRICLGMNMAIFEAKIAAAMLLREYSFSISEEERKKITYLPNALTMSIINTRGTESERKYDSHNLWLLPSARSKAKK
eukprot:TRINITY_DN41438_c0_g1_i1.p1 TRINITY_DN41438_c0_g1~~TRINITY_DN41438_c0_g1_i1.p1  ORF type:complete len:552 (-),score=98.61 TRINITY_DN41438_c0_g1_i1:37-1692(-)